MQHGYEMGAGSRDKVGCGTFHTLHLYFKKIKVNRLSNSRRGRWSRHTRRVAGAWNDLGTIPSWLLGQPQAMPMARLKNPTIAWPYGDE